MSLALKFHIYRNPLEIYDIFVYTENVANAADYASVTRPGTDDSRREVYEWIV